MTERSADGLLLELARRGAGAGPAFAHVLLADRCNHSCRHCYQVQGEKGELGLEDVKAFLRGFRHAGGFVVSFSGGEATLRDDLVPIVAFAHELGLATILHTNAFTMTLELASALASASLWRAEVSVYSDREAEHDQVTRVPGSWTRTVDGIRNLRRAGVAVRMKTPLLASCRPTLLGLQALARELDCSLSISEQIMGREDGDLLPLEERPEPDFVVGLAPLQSEWCTVDAPSSVMEPAAADARRPGSLCSAGLGTGTLRSDGVLQPCPNLFIELARLERGELRDVAGGAEASALFRSLAWSDLHGCRDCDLASLCHRCHATAGAEAGDLFGPYRGACEIARARHARATGRGTILAPEPSCEPARDARVGPYRIAPEGLRPIPDIVTDADRDLRLRFAWIAPRGPVPGLIQLGRKANPGRG